MTAVASQFESILELLQKDEMSKVQEELSKLKDITKDSFDVATVETVIKIVELLLEKTSSSDVMSSEEFLMNDTPMIPILITAAQYCEGEKETERELMDIYSNLYDIYVFRGEFEKGLEYTRKSLDIANKSDVVEYKAEATLLCANAAMSCALGLASGIIESAKAEEGELSVPESIEDKAIEFINLVVDYSHEAYLLYLKLALDGAIGLGLVDASLSEKLDDENILETVGTLSSSLEQAERTDDVMMIINHLETAVEMNEKCTEYDGIGIVELIDMVQNACEGSDCDSCGCGCDDCDCGGDCKCCDDDDEEEEEVEVKSCKRGCCDHSGHEDKKLKK